MLLGRNETNSHGWSKNAWQKNKSVLRGKNWRDLRNRIRSDRPKQKKPDKNQPDKGSKVPRSQNGVRRGLRASALAKKRERPLTQFDLKKVINGESSETNYRSVPPSQVFDFSLGAAGDQVEVDNASYPPQPSSDSSAADNSIASGKLPQLASDSREPNQAAERPAREEQEKLVMEEEERLVREEQERVTHEEQERAAREEETPATEGKERLVKNIAKQWEERLGQEMRKEKTQDQRRPKVVGKGVQRGIGAATRNRPLTQFALETLKDAEPQEFIQGPSHQTEAENERRTIADQEEVGNPIHSAQPSADSSATDNSNSISASGKIPEHVTNSEEPIQVELQTTRPPRDQRPDPAIVWIKFKIRDRGGWRVVQDLEVDPSDPSEVKRIAMKYMRKWERMHIFNINLRMLTPQTCFEDITADGTNTILLIPERDIDINSLPSSVFEKRSDLQTNSEAYPSTPEPNPEDGKEDREQAVRKRVARRGSSQLEIEESNR
ncbi:uncharacterized protein PAC_16219 [Phialocephala subalpina]|uniref:Uncharacterized protein n=1 Tax=Phialocephala subalpina TaxID=576137 RepID=A0A1L7XMS2_9HELO|nr:uncharacterized protein PAC_16219 [Phialocephala subalpina]